ncbi:MAG: TlpA family protein disulfide reductase [Bacteroidales bacterium]|nr:TlpA family protein disulfide reductase [Bacteroidales bacterium]
MKSIVLVVALVFIVSIGLGQESEKNYGKLPSIIVKSMDGRPFNTADLSNDGNPFIITFWATWCKPCIKEHDAINDVYGDWVDETGVKMFAVSIDNARSSKRVLPTINGKGWEFDILLDENSDFKRAMNVNVPPHTFIVNGEGLIVWQHVGYLDGDEEEYIEIIEKIIAGEEIE